MSNTVQFSSCDIIFRTNVIDNVQDYVAEGRGMFNVIAHLACFRMICADFSLLEFWKSGLYQGNYNLFRVGHCWQITDSC